jgi:hypothetical protein
MPPTIVGKAKNLSIEKHISCFLMLTMKEARGYSHSSCGNNQPTLFLLYRKTTNTILSPSQPLQIGWTHPIQRHYED